MLTKHSSSLKARLLRIPFLTILVMTAIIAFILFLEYRSINSWNDTLETSSHYEQFSSALNDCQTSFTGFSGSLERKYSDQFQEASGELTSVFDRILADFPDSEEILTLQSDLEEYLSLCRSLITDGAVMEISAFWSDAKTVNALYDRLVSEGKQIQLLYLQKSITNIQGCVQLWHYQLRIIIPLVMTIILVLLLTLSHMAARILQPIDDLVKRSEAISAGRYEEDSDPLPEIQIREIAVLYQAFSSMACTIHSQMSALQEKIDLSARLHELEVKNMNAQLALSEKENALMQSMINPHFLFNSLSTVSSMAVIEDAPQTEDIANRIAHYLRTSLNLVGSRITIGEELRVLKEYFYIQSLRTGSRIRSEIECDPQCEGVLIPALLLQPIVENSYLHGLKACLKDGRISVRISEKPNGKIELNVADNGCGVDELQRESILKKIKEPYRAGEGGIGLHSAGAQLENLYHNNYRFDIVSAPGQGMQVCIEIPTVKD